MRPVAADLSDNGRKTWGARERRGRVRAHPVIERLHHPRRRSADCGEGRMRSWGGGGASSSPSPSAQTVPPLCSALVPSPCGLGGQSLQTRVLLRRLWPKENFPTLLQAGARPDHRSDLLGKYNKITCSTEGTFTAPNYALASGFALLTCVFIF